LVGGLVHRPAPRDRGDLGKIASENDGADAGNDAVPVAQSWARLVTSIETTHRSLRR